ncbi:MAG: hypothetical protein QOG70_1409 [Solirubrobacteraceae bacterium]|jgi:hypothetical protein|nr:hypothetical protein [Solirubrobacteraceae bacterium]
MRRLASAGAFVLAAMMVAAVPGAAGAAGSSSPDWHPAPKGGLDCNGFSPVQTTFRQMICTEIASNSPNGYEDNGHYVGHDEPDIGFFSSQHGSGNSMSYRMVLPVDPAQDAQRQFGGVTHDFQLSPAHWFGMTMCDTESYPEGTKTCRPDSDANIQVPPRADHAGAAFMELQLYPPGFSPIISCDQTHWCAALTIDSLQAEFGALHGPGTPPGAKANDNCPEPVNFAYLTHSGRPVGPPGPDAQTDATFTPTADTLLMNPGDTVVLTMHDTRAGLFTELEDVTTHQRGFMTASVANGFRHILWDPVNSTCNGAPYGFHPMYDTAAAPLANGQPTAWTTWSAHTDNVAYDVETGHFEPPDATADDAAGVGPDEDSPCFPGPMIPGCLGSDSDFDGYPYHADWPNGSSTFTTPFYISSPRSPGDDRGNGRGNDRGPRQDRGAYPVVRFETDLPRIEEANNGGALTCDHHTGDGCVNPPPAPDGSSAFYPWYHLFSLASERGTTCAWALTNDGVPNEVSNFGGEQAGWGPLEKTDYGFDQRFHNFARTLPGNPCP